MLKDKFRFCKEKKFSQHFSRSFCITLELKEFVCWLLQHTQRETFNIDIEKRKRGIFKRFTTIHIEKNGKGAENRRSKNVSIVYIR